MSRVLGTSRLLETIQGFRKYLTQARDHEELLAFLLGQIIKEKVRYFQLQRHQQPEVISVKVAELEERVSVILRATEPCTDRICRPRSMTSSTLRRSSGADYSQPMAINFKMATSLRPSNETRIDILTK